MLEKSTQSKLQILLSEAVRGLCQKELESLYSKDLSIRGLLGVTLDSDDILLIDIHEFVVERTTQMNFGSDHEEVTEAELSGNNDTKPEFDSQSEQPTEHETPSQSKLVQLLNVGTSDVDVVDNSERNGRKELSRTKALVSAFLSDQNEFRNESDTHVLEAARSSAPNPDSTRRVKKSATLRPQICYLCGLSTKNLYGLKNHLATVHNEGATFTCSICSKGFLQRQSYEDHLNAHKGNKAHMCPICGKRTPFASSLRRHLKQHREHSEARAIERPFRCSQCPSKFKTEHSMREHVNTEHLDRRIRCACDKEFKWRSALARHKAKCVFAQNSSVISSPARDEPKTERQVGKNETVAKSDGDLGVDVT